ncbi:hypothetical protein MAR_035545, partial [Mya arenaria]
TLDTVKDIHRSIVSANNVTSYIVNPINIFHLVKRLSRDWNKLSRPKEALRTIESILQLDPNNNNAKRNKEYILIKINEGMKETKINTPILRTKKDRLLQKFCRVKNEMRDLLYKDHYTYPNGIDGFIVDDWTYWQWIPKLRETLNNIDLSFNRPAFSHFMVKNIGLEGYETTPLWEFTIYKTRCTLTFVMLMS